MIKHKKVLWITRTAILIALTVVLQFTTLQFAPVLGPLTQFLTGSIVNLMLILSVMTCGLTTGLTVAVFTPIMPTLLGFGPVWPVVPFISAGNMALCAVWHFIGNRKIVNTYVSFGLALIAGAVAKFLVLYIGVVQLAMRFIPGLPQPLAFMFSYPQIITASIGGACAIILLSPLKKAMKGWQAIE